VAFLSPQIIGRLLINKISIINFNLDALRYANYNALKTFKGKDELSTIVENIVHVKNSVIEREKQLKDAKLLAEAADKLKSAFLGNMSHEIRTPLNAVVGFSQLLRDSNPSSDDIEKYVGLINSNSNKLLQIINDIIDLSQIESGQMILIAQPLYLNELFSELYGFAQSKLRSEKLVFNTKFISIFIDNEKIPSGEHITIDPYRLKQIMEQLIDNAIKFTCKGDIRMGYTLEDDSIELYVSDTGVGIAKENIPKIFQRFVQAEDFMTREYGGTGLGLAICNELVRMMGGTIHVETKLNEGSTFSIRIPIKGI
jgi:signal transduction histidine kinase